MSEQEKLATAQKRTVETLARMNLNQDTSTSIEHFAERERDKWSLPCHALANMSDEDFKRLMAIVKHARKIPDRHERAAYSARQCEAIVTEYVALLGTSHVKRSKACTNCARLTDSENQVCGPCARAVSS